MIAQTTEPQELEVFYVLDLDRSLVDTDALVVLLQRIIMSELGIDAEEIIDARREYEAQRGVVFDIAEYVMGVMDQRGEDGPAVWQRIKHLFIRAARKRDVLEPGGFELLQWLESRKQKFGILTYGGDTWQLTKMDAAGLISVPHIVTHNEQKGKLIASWQLKDNSFLVPALIAGGRPARARKLVFIDDKPVSFIGIPPEVESYCAIARGVAWPQDILALVPRSVHIVQGVREVMRSLS